MTLEICTGFHVITSQQTEDIEFSVWCLLVTRQTSLSSRGNSTEQSLQRTCVHFTCEENNSPISQRNVFQTGYYELVTKAFFSFLDIDSNRKGAWRG